MKTFTIESAELFAALKRCEKAVDKRADDPVLSKVFVEVSGNSIRFTTTDLSTWITSIAKLSEGPRAAARTLTPFAPLYKASQALKSSGKIVIDLSDAGAFVLRSGRREYSFASDSNTEGFPPQGDPTLCKPLSEFLTPGDALVKALKSVSAAMGCDDYRPYLKGVCFDGSDGRPVAVAIDGHRLHCHKLQCSNMNDIGNLRHIVPADAVKAICEIASGDDEISVRFYDDKVYFDGASFRAVSEFAAGTFPDYVRCMPRPDKKWASVAFDVKPVADFLKAARAAVLESPTSSVRITVSGRGFSITAKSNDAQLSQKFSARISNCEENRTIESGFNCKYLAEALCGLDTAELYILDGASPILLLSDDPDIQRVVMPMRI